MAKPRRKKRCAYCTRYGPDSMDHVVARAFFVTVPNNIVTVPSCKRCNTKKKHLDEFIRDAMATDIHAEHHPRAKELWEGPITRAISRKQSNFFRFVFPLAQPVHMLSKSGLVVDQAFQIPDDGQTYYDYFRYLIRGLHYKAEGSILPGNRRVSIRRMTTLGWSTAIDHFKATYCDYKLILGDNVFRAVRQSHSKDPTLAYWLVSFFEGINYVAFTRPSLSVPQFLRRP